VNSLLPKVKLALTEKIACKGSVSFTVRLLKHFGFQYTKLMVNEVPQGVR
jgi:hypothetical protein